jgi:hypothetical protein
MRVQVVLSKKQSPNGIMITQNFYDEEDGQIYKSTLEVRSACCCGQTSYSGERSYWYCQLCGKDLYPQPNDKDGTLANWFAIEEKSVEMQHRVAIRRFVRRWTGLGPGKFSVTVE